MPCRGAVGTGWRGFLTCPSPVLGVLSIRPTQALLLLRPVLHVPSSSCEEPRPELQEKVLLGTVQTSSPGGRAWRGEAGAAGAAQVTGEAGVPTARQPWSWEQRWSGVKIFQKERERERQKKKKQKNSTSHKTAQLGACMGRTKTDTNHKKARVKIKLKKK